MTITAKDFSKANLTNESFDSGNLSEANFKQANLTNTTFRSANLTGANFKCADLNDTNFFLADLGSACLMDANARKAKFVGANLANANLCNADLTFAVFRNANLTNVNLHLVDLSGADLTDAVLTGAIGLGNKSSEIAFANRLLDILARGEGQLEQKVWHNECQTIHCIAGWGTPDVKFPGAQASRMYPTLAKFFFSTNEVVMEALHKVATGELSVFPN
jgi:hypothetical protein